MRALVEALAVIACVFCLTGCLAKNVVHPGASFKANPDHGVVVFSVSHDHAAVSGRTSLGVYVNDAPAVSRLGGLYESAPENIASLLSMGLASSKNSMFPDVHGQLYVIDLPEGDHTMKSWVFNQGSLETYPAGKYAPLKFHLSRGQVIYIGNIHASLTSEVTFLGVVKLRPKIYIKDGQVRDLSKLRELHGSFAERIKPELLPLGEWAAPEGVLRHNNGVPPTYSK